MSTLPVRVSAIVVLCFMSQPAWKRGEAGVRLTGVSTTDQGEDISWQIKQWCQSLRGEGRAFPMEWRST